jgi:hypothetical protein
VATKTTNAMAPQRRTQKALGFRVRATDARHDAASPLGRGGRRAESV